MSQLLDRLRKDFQDEDARYGYTEAFLNAFVAAQIKTLREYQELSQVRLGEMIGTKQSGISRLENVNYSSWKVQTLRKLARALGVRLRISFEEFGTLIPEVERFKKETLRRREFKKDPVFNPGAVAARTSDIGATVATPTRPTLAFRRPPGKTRTLQERQEDIGAHLKETCARP